MLRMELAQRGMVQLMATDFEVPLFAVEGVCGVIVKSTNSFDERGTAVHGRRQLDRRSSGNLGPPLMETLLVQEHDRELLDLILFHIPVTGGAAGEEGEGQSGPGYDQPQPETCFPRMDRGIGGTLCHDW